MHVSVDYDKNNIAQLRQENKTVNSYSVNNADTVFTVFCITVPSPVLLVTQNYWLFFFSQSLPRRRITNFTQITFYYFVRLDYPCFVSPPSTFSPNARYSRQIWK